jgi:hypothetical protein
MIKTILKVLGAVADAWNTYQSLKRDDLRDRVNDSPDAEWMRQFNPDPEAVPVRKTNTAQPEVDKRGRDHDEPK